MPVSYTEPYCPNCSGPDSYVRCSDGVCIKCGWKPVDPSLDPDLRRKPDGEKQNQLLHVLVTKTDYVRILEVSKGQPVSKWCREALKKALDAAEATNTADGVGVID